MWKLNLHINKTKYVKLEAGREEVTNPKSSGNNFVNEYKYLSCVTTRNELKCSTRIYNGFVDRK